MAGGRLLLPAKCPRCLASLLRPDVPVDGLPSVGLLAGVGGRIGFIHLSQVYGSLRRRFVDVADLPGAVEAFACPSCLHGLPAHGICACGAPMVEVDLEGGGLLGFCTRNGCREHHLQFEEIDDAFVVFEGQGE